MNDFRLPRGVTRRAFFATGTRGVLGLGVVGRLAGAMPTSMSIAISTTRAARRLPPAAFFPEPLSDELFCSLALAAMDAAHAAGAEFADIRVGMQREISVPPYPHPPSAAMTVGYGVRARVNGTWGFQYGSLMTADAVRGAAQSAVAGARRSAATNVRLGRTAPRELAPAPVVTGEWRSPCEIDPFTVPMDDFHRITEAIAETTAKVYQNHPIGGGGATWRAESRVFASTEGSLVTQHFMRGGPGLGGYTTLPENPFDKVYLDVPGIDSVSAGFETALRTDWIDRLQTGLEEIIRLRELPLRAFRDVGRFPVAFEGATFANIIANTANMALDGDRVMGIEADASGTSYLVPPDDILDAAAPAFSPLLTVTADRALPSVVAVQWDDEGVVPEPYTVIDRGRVVEYHTTRETAPMLSAWAAKHGRPVRLRGGAVASIPTALPVCGGMQMQVTPSASRARVDDFMRTMTHGFVVRSGWADPEPGLTAGMMGTGIVVEVVRGKPVSRTTLSLEFVTKSLLKEKLVAIGDATTVRGNLIGVSKGIPYRQVVQPVAAPAALCKDVDVFAWLDASADA